MAGRAKTYLIIGIVFIVLGIVMIVADASRVMAYGDITIGICFLAFSQREQKKNGGGK